MDRWVVIPVYVKIFLFEYVCFRREYGVVSVGHCVRVKKCFYLCQKPPKGGVEFAWKNYSATLTSKCYNFFSIGVLSEMYVRQKFSLCLFPSKHFDFICSHHFALFLAKQRFFGLKLRILAGNRQNAWRLYHLLRAQFTTNSNTEIRFTGKCSKNSPKLGCQETDFTAIFFREGLGGLQKFPACGGLWLRGETFGGHHSKSGGLELSKVAPSNVKIFKKKPPFVFFSNVDGQKWGVCSKIPLWTTTIQGKFLPWIFE
jgi:hypothetical protein